MITNNVVVRSAVDASAGGVRLLPAAGPRHEDADKSTPMKVSVTANGRALSPTEVGRMISAGPMMGRQAGDLEVTEWLAGLEVQAVAPEPYQSAWDAFVEEKIDTEIMLPRWLSAAATDEVLETIDEVAAEDMVDAGWLWTIADDSVVNAYDAGSVLTSDYAQGFDPLAVDGVHGFVFRSAARQGLVLRHVEVAAQISDM